MILIAKALTVMVCVAATYQLAMNCHRVTAAGTLFLAILVVLLMPDDAKNDTPEKPAKKPNP